MQVRNNITLIGNLGAAPISTTLASGTCFTEFRLATNDYYRDKEGNRKERTEWHRVKAFGKLAEVLAEHLTKGSQVCIAGALRYNKWIDKYDQVRTSAEIIASEFTFLSASKGQASEAMSAETAAPANQAVETSAGKRKGSTSKQRKVQEVA